MGEVCLNLNGECNVAKDEFEILRKVWPDGNRYQDFFRVAAACWIKNHADIEKYMIAIGENLESGKINLSEYELFEQVIKELQEYNNLSEAQDG